MYEAIFSDEFKRQLKKLKKKDKVIYERLKKKIKNILIDPHNFKHLKNILKGEQRTPWGPFVLRFKVSENKVYLITFRHHDFAY
ncbi:addiction module toxin RelE [Candidatus Pacearchaeota archaeon]|jgi:mRNA-degrading endonuclease RelE of RelBE toxin-antitoxin system|nr:addiction module toxin RelE [Candidatus Pacearchaeota archaeon]|tara:strand:- start:17279 stop:17530 length:252 start_codon:yes stop_codon:yes gene_type:complete